MFIVVISDVTLLFMFVSLDLVLGFVGVLVLWVLLVVLCFGVLFACCFVLL